MLPLELGSPPSSPQNRLRSVDADREIVRGYTRAVKIACDDLHADPFDPDALAQIEMVLRQSEVADAARTRLLRPQPADPVALSRQSCRRL
jgi:hypothetical protein